jgi:four helix bundle protein
MHTYSFEKLEVWQLSRKLIVSVYKLTKSFPPDEKVGMISQMRRASVSVCSNLAEGSGRKTAKDQASFYNTSYSSLMELLNQLIISVDLGWLEAGQLIEIRNEIEILSNKINSLRNSRLR